MSSRCLEEKINESDEALKVIDKRLDDVMAQLPSMITIGNNLSIQPVKLPLFISNPLGFKAVCGRNLRRAHRKTLGQGAR